MPILATKQGCTGCMSCLNTCAKGAIEFKEDKEGFLQPVVDGSKCVECHLCEQSCPEVQNQYHQNRCKPDIYAGWNITDRCISSSGGAFSSVARFILAQGGIVYGVTLDEDFNCKHIEVNSFDGLDKLRGSKYIQSTVALSYRAVKRHLLADKYVLFTGTPCQVSGLLSYLGKDYPKLVTMDLVCHGVPSNALFKKYITKLEKRLGFAENKKILNYEFRRRNGWGESPSISTTSNDCKKVYGINSIYMSAFDKSAILRNSCYDCHYAKPTRVGDFSVGDFWGLGHQGVPFKHDMTKGVSLLIVNSEKGRMIMKALDADNFYEKRTLEEATARNHNLSKVSNKPFNRDKVILAFMSDEMSLDAIEKVHKLLDKSLKKRLSTLCSTIGLYDLLKKIHNYLA